MLKIEFDDDYVIESLGIQEIDVYDIEVEDNHNFFGNNICVHNSIYVNVEGIVDKIYPGSDPNNDEDRSKITDMLTEFAKTLEEKAISVALEKMYKTTNAYDPCLNMKVEAIGQGVWRASKNYIMSVWSMEGIKYQTPVIKMTGIEAVKSSTPEICRNYIKDSISYIVKKDEAGLIKHIEKCVEEFYSMPFDKIGKPSGVTDIDKWIDSNTIFKKGVPYHVRGAITYNNLVDEKNLNDVCTKIQNGDKMRICYMLLPNPTGQNIFAVPDELPEEFRLEGYIDYVKQIDKTFLKPVNSLASLADIDLDGKKKLDEFY